MNFKPNLIKTKNADGTLVDAPKVRTIDQYMVPLSSLITFNVNENIYHVMFTMISKKISGAPVLDDNGIFVGVISEKDCLNVLCEVVYNQQEKSRRVSDYMTTDVATVSSDVSVLEMAEKFISSSYRRFPIVDSNFKLIGQISRRDILRAAMDLKT